VQPPAEPIFRPGVDWRATRPSIIVAGILAAMAAMIAPFGGIGVLFWTFLATLVVVRLYARRPDARLSGASGARLGAATGLAAFLAWVILFLVAIFGLRQGPQLHEFVIKSMREASANYPTPQATQAMDFITSNSGFATFIVLMLVLLLVFSVICGALAGALGGALFVRGRR
jgi:cobalamin synthase